MIVSASRRTDIPAFFSEWFLQRIKAGFVHVRNPMNPRQVSQVNLNSDVVDGIVFWTKNPAPMLSKLAKIAHYPYYFQITLNAYGQDVEQKIPSKSKFIIPAFQELAQRIGKNRVLWRYDPIFLNSKYTLEYHCKYFEILAKNLSPYTEKCTISFINLYKKIQKNMKSLGLIDITEEQKNKILQEFLCIATAYGLKLETCAENAGCELQNIAAARCIDSEIFEKIFGAKLHILKDNTQRMGCGCMKSVDIGEYNTCKNNCLYCYANLSPASVIKNLAAHDDNSSLLVGKVSLQDKVNERKMQSCKQYNISFL